MPGRDWILPAILGLVFLPAVLGLAETWSSVDYYSHGFLVPLVAAWAALHARPGWSRLERRPERRAPLLVGVALGLYFVGLGAGVLALQGVALVGAVAATILHLGGVAWLRALAFPVAYLLFMVPVPPAWITPTIVGLQLVVTRSAVALLHLGGIPVSRDGNVILLPGGESLFVAEACSGITSIVTLTPLAVLLAYFSLCSLPRRLALVALVVPVALVANLARVAGTVWLADSIGAARATGGAFHESAGLLAFLASCLLVIAASAWLRRGEPLPQPAA